jgi:ubiquinone/menaquinone biosynthesis C-methylase UbiE
MNQNDRKKIVKFYEDSFSLYGNDPRSVHWTNDDTQRIRFEVLNRIADVKNKKVLDVGCGLGDLYVFFMRHAIDIDYTGIDIVPSFINRARERFLEARFVLGGVESLTDMYDYIFVSGTFNVRIDNAESQYFEMLRKLFVHAHHGIAFNMLDIQSHQSDDTYVAYDRDMVVAFCKTLTPHVTFIDGYLPWDFTVYMYRYTMPYIGK